MGVVSALGIGQAQNLESLKQGRSGIASIRYLDTEHREFPVGEVPLSNAEMEAELAIPKGTPTTRSSLMGTLAMREALAQAQLTASRLSSVGLVSATTVGGMDKSEQFYLDFINNDSRNEYIATHDCGACSDMIADYFGGFASVTTVSTACSSAANAIILGANLLREGLFECVVVGGTECVTKFHLNGFNTLMILDRQPCRPFSADRAGLNLGEGAAYLVLETADSARRRGAVPLAYLSGYGNACDAYHQTASSPEGDGAFLAMKEALAMAGLSSVGYINAHGTGTPNNDDSESNAIRRVFAGCVPPISSTKSMTGHTTSASGAVESVFSILALRHQFLPAKRLDGNPQLLLSALTAPRHCDTPLDAVLCNAFGFGGNDSSLLFTSYPASSWDGVVQRCTHSPQGNATCRPEVYVRAVNHISAQKPLCDDWSQVDPGQSFVPAIDPDFKPFVAPSEARRMGPLLKRAVAVSKSVIEQAGGHAPDALITGTGLGCVLSTEKFLSDITLNGEHLLKPTHFMQSTHNTIGSTLAIHTHNHGYNTTYSHLQTSFESALLDAYLQIGLGRIGSALVGGHDELTSTYARFLQKSNRWGTSGDFVSENAVAAYLTSSPQEALCRLSACLMGYRPSVEWLHGAVDQLHLSSRSVAVLTAVSGNGTFDQTILDECADLFPGLPLLRYKHLFGEGYTSSAVAFYVAATCLHNQSVPQCLAVCGTPAVEGPLDAILIFNHTCRAEYAFTLLERV